MTDAGCNVRYKDCRCDLLADHLGPHVQCMPGGGITWPAVAAS